MHLFLLFSSGVSPRTGGHLTQPRVSPGTAGAISGRSVREITRGKIPPYFWRLPVVKGASYVLNCYDLSPLLPLHPIKNIPQLFSTPTAYQPPPAGMCRHSVRLQSSLSICLPQLFFNTSRQVPCLTCLRPYHLEYTSSRPITEVKQG